jgi:hypothetical protein
MIALSNHYGIQNAHRRLLAYQISDSSCGPLPNWRWMDVDQISDLQLIRLSMSARSMAETTPFEHKLTPRHTEFRMAPDLTEITIQDVYAALVDWNRDVARWS